MDGLRTDNYPDGFSEYWFEQYWGNGDEEDGWEDDDDDAEYE